jgi:formylglycine-generating enzyme required for sulfatase activity
LGASVTDRGVSYEGRPPPPAVSGGERRVALVIGNGRYTHAAALDNPARDAEAIAAVLAKVGFDVVKGLDLDLHRIGDVQSAFEDKLRGKPDVALLFYAGHGLQVEGRNYLVPIDAEITTKSHLATRALLFNDLLDDMARDAAASLIFLDACRDNPFTRNLARSMGDAARYAGVRGGLARIEKVAGTFIAYATAPDQVAFDGKGANSPFTSALLAHIETPGLSVGDLMIDVRNEVLAETSGRQEPWDQSSLRARFYFVPPEPEKPRPGSDAAMEWAAIQGTTSLAVLAKYQERHPDPPWFDYAEARADELRAADAARQAAEVTERQQAEAKAEAARAREQAAKVATAAATSERPTAPSAPQSPVGPRVVAEPRVAAERSMSVGLLGGGAFAVAAVVAALVWRPWDRPSPPPIEKAPAPKATTAEPSKPKPQPKTAEACTGFRAEVVGKGSLCLDPADKSKREFEDCEGGFCAPVMVALPTGDYLQGDETKKVDGLYRRKVTIGYHLAVGKFEVTFAEWDACVDDGGCKHKPKDEWGRGRQPAINASWNDITKEYLPWLNRKLGLTGERRYRLLTEAEWEYAARAGTTTAYSFGDRISKKQAQFSEGSWGSAKQTVKAGSFPSNAFGLHDMHGNVWEWVEDAWVDNYNGAPSDGSARTSADTSVSRVVRGGSWYYLPRYLRSAFRVRTHPDNRYGYLGFRLARTLNP